MVTALQGCFLCKLVVLAVLAKLPLRVGAEEPSMVEDESQKEPELAPWDL